MPVLKIRWSDREDQGERAITKSLGHKPVRTAGGGDSHVGAV